MPSPELITLVYVSSATSLMSEQDLETLLLNARTLNLQNDLTGILLYNEGSFIQCLEGPERPLLDTYERIQCSRGHTDITEMFRGPIAHRSFSSWDMGFCRPTRSEQLALSNARWRAAKEDASEQASTSAGLILLQDFWRRASSR